MTNGHNRGDVRYSKEHDLLVISLGEGRSLYIRGDGTLVPQGTEQPIPAGSLVNVMHYPQLVLASIVRMVRDGILNQALLTSSK